MSHLLIHGTPFPRNYFYPMDDAPRDGSWVLVAYAVRPAVPGDPRYFLKSAKWDAAKASFVDVSFCSLQNPIGWTPHLIA